jgi:hypothetical protein
MNDCKMPLNAYSSACKFVFRLKVIFIKLIEFVLSLRIHKLANWILPYFIHVKPTCIACGISFLSVFSSSHRVHVNAGVVFWLLYGLHYFAFSFLRTCLTCFPLSYYWPEQKSQQLLARTALI